MLNTVSKKPDLVFWGITLWVSMSAEITLSSLFDFNKPFKKRKEPMVTFKKQPFCLAAEENVNLYGSYLFFDTFG